MSGKKRSRAAGRPAGGTTRRATGNPTSRPSGRTSAGAAPNRPALPTDVRARIGLLVVAIILIAVVAILAEVAIGAISNQGGGSAQTGMSTATATQSGAPGQSAAPVAIATQFGVIVQGNGGHWTNVSPDQLAQMLQSKDFTLVNVKTPYIGEIAGTDLYIPYDQLTANASKLPPDKAAKILVYCRTGTTSKIATQTLLGLGYTNVWNLAGGMDAWTASGRTLVDLHR